MTILKSIAVAFSMYSRIPMPHFKWGSEDMKYHLIFFPFVGALIGLLELLLRIFFRIYDMPYMAFVALAVAMPLIVTGGFHLDGFMDTSDALSSWQTKEKRLEILKDSHIGAFSVIDVLIIGLLIVAGIAMMNDVAFSMWCTSFFIARCVSGIFVVKGQKAKSEGLLHTEARTASGNIVLGLLIAEAVLSSIAAIVMSPIYAVVMIIMIGVVAAVYKKVAYDKFGGITGDLAGWFLVNAEVFSGFVLGFMSLIWR